MNQYPIYDQGTHYVELHEDHKNWLDELEFCAHEIAFFEQLLEDFFLTHKLADRTILVERFQNKLMLQARQVALYQKDLKKQEKKLVEFVKTHEKNIEFITFGDHKVWRDKMDIQRRLYKEMKHEFYQALTKKT